MPGDLIAGDLFDPRSLIPVIALPEGTARIRVFRRLFSKQERVYDELWRYVRPVNRRIYKGQGAAARIGDYDMGLRAPNRIPALVDFRAQRIYVGKKLRIPFSSVRGVLAAHGMLPWRVTPVFVLMLRLEGVRGYLPLHQCLTDWSVVHLADFLSAHLHAPLGIASNPLKIVVEPGASVIRHAKGETPLYQVRGMLTNRSPDGRAIIKLLLGARPLTVVDAPDPLGWIEGWGLVTEDLLNIVTRRTKHRYGES